MSEVLFLNTAQVVTCAGPARARRGAEMNDLGLLKGAAVAVSDDRIAAVGPQPELERRFPDVARVDCQGGVLLPGWVDSHTHAIFGRPRADEQELRAAGASYMEIAARGGGIHASVRDLRQRSEDELFALALGRLRRLAAYGTTTIEVKSGYGLTVEDELKELRVIARLAEALPVRLVPTWLGAHEIPLEYRSTRNKYVDLLVNDMLPRVVADRLARFADVFCEPGVFTVAESRTILTAGPTLLACLALFFLGGEVLNGIAFALHALATRPDLLARLRTSKEQDKEIGRFNEEVLRFYSPVPQLPRIARKETLLCGKTIPQGALVFLCWASGNRDSQRFAEADKFDPDRTNTRQHLAFGTGVHFCLGSMLARQEMKCALREIVNSVESLELAVPPDQLDLSTSMVILRGLKSLPVRFRTQAT